MMRGNTIEVFFAFVQAGLWGASKDIVNLNDKVDWENVYQLAQEQSVQGIVLQGIEWFRSHNVNDNLNPNNKINIPQGLLLQWIGEVQMIELRNKDMNSFVAELIEKLRKYNIYTLLVKGQGVAQCYERPLWRSSGDIDLYLNESDFQKAKKYFRPLVEKFDPDDDFTRHINMHYGEWVVEIHANQNCSLSPRINKVLCDVHKDLFNLGNVRCWDNNGTQIFLPSADNDAIIIFTHFLGHFYKGGVGLRQVCDWCRLLWTYRDSLNHELLESRICKAGLMSEWKVFGSFAVKYLGMPIEAMPFLNENDNLKNKADKICEFILEVGNFGHNRDTSYYGKYPFLVRKAISFSRRLKDLIRHARIFPLDSLRFFFGMTISSFRAVSHGE